MIEPVRHNLNLYKNTDFILKFRLKEGGSVVDLSSASVYFHASSGGSPLEIEKSNVQSPAGIVIENDIVTVTVTAAETLDLTAPELRFEVDTVIAGVKNRRWTGLLYVYENVI